MNGTDSTIFVSPERNLVSTDRKRKRPKVPEEQRKRATVACGNCRRLKEKCDGNVPCQRCRRYGRSCEPAAPVRKATSPPEGGDGGSSENERIHHLEAIARHFLGDVPLETNRLKEIVNMLESDITSPNAADSSSIAADADEDTIDEERFTVKPLSQNAAHYSGEFSTWNFSQRIKNQVDKRLQDVEASNVHEKFHVLDHWRANHLNSRDVHVQSVTDSLPPKRISLFLVRVYFRHAQTNSFFVDETRVLARLDEMYADSIKAKLKTEDATWICTVLCVLAVGTQFAHLDRSQSAQVLAVFEPGSESAIDALGASLYHMAADLIPAVLTIASVESVQAFLMLAHYALPLDTQGLAFTYLGLALNMAIQNGMHRKHDGEGMDPTVIDLRNRLWWTVYKLEKRVSILHGRPRSIACVDIDAEYPPDKLPGSDGVISPRAHENISTKITDWLGDLAFLIHMLRKSPKRLRHAYFQRLLRVRQQYKDWWKKIVIPETDQSLRRATLQLRLSHHLTFVFLGRSFMLSEAGKGDYVAFKEKKDGGGKANLFDSKRSELVQDAISSAIKIIELCQDLHTSIGLARSSYVEFTSCRASILVLLARSLQQPSEELRTKLDQGLKLIEYMAPANASTQSDASLLTAVGAALQLLDSKRIADQPHLHAPAEISKGELALENIKGWAQARDGGQDVTPLDDFDFGTSIPFNEFGWDPLDASFLPNEPYEPQGFSAQYFDEAFDIAYGEFRMMDLPSVANRE